MRVFFASLLFLLCLGLMAQDEIIMSPEMLPDDTSKVRILNELSVQLVYSNPSKAVSYIEEALQVAEKIEDFQGLAESYINYGKMLFGVDNTIKSAEYYFNALSIGEETGDEKVIATAKNYIATVYISLQDYNVAHEYLLDAIELNRKNSEENLLAANYNNIGMVYLARDNYSTALEYFFMSLDINQKLDNRDWISNNYGNIGTTYSKMNNPKAVDYFNKRIELKQELEDETGIASGYEMLSGYYLGQKMWDDAIGPLNIALEISLEEKSWDLAASCLNMLSQVHRTLGDYQQAYETHVRYDAMVDSTKKDELTRIVASLELEHQYEKEQKKLEEIESQRRLRNYIIVSSLLAAMIILILLVRNQKGKISRTQLEKKLLEEELEHKNRELTTNMLYLLRKNELIECISDKLIGLRKNLKKENQHVIQTVISDLRSNLDNNVWEEFEIRFKDVHGSFYDDLQRDFPDLTVGEKRLCAFLRLDMSTKEISAITGQSISSLEVARTRLRKKLHISNTQIGLSQFLSNY